MLVQYNPFLVAISVLVAILASYTALSLSSRVAAGRSSAASFAWLAGGACSMGFGIWSMHFVGMLAASLPIPMAYDLGWTLLSLLIAIVISGFALSLVSGDSLGWRKIGAGGALMGFGISSMHYVGMAAIEVAPGIVYQPLLFVASVFIAMAASCVALWLFFNLRDLSRRFWPRAAAAVVMGFAIICMHYTGMAAAHFSPDSVCTAPTDSVSNLWLAACLAGVTVLMLGTTLIVAMFDARLADRTAVHEASQQKMNERLLEETARLAHSNDLLRHEVSQHAAAQARIWEQSMTLERLNAELEERVRVRTLELQVANHELEAFAYSVSHDLRAPLSSIAGFSSLLARTAADRLEANSLHYMQRIQGSVTTMSELIDGLLSLARLSRTEVRQEDVDLSRLAHEILADLAHSDTSSSRGPMHSVVQEGITCRGDRRLLRQLLANLIGNAWKFTARQPRPRIEFGCVQDEHGKPAFFVRDNGAGFDMRHVDKLFGAFQRLHSVEEFEGHGIGLATVRRIVTRHGGRVWVEAAPGEGACFYFTVPSVPIDGPLKKL